MTAGRCRWTEDIGRCPDPIAFPGLAPQVPELCVRHIWLLEPWIAAKARQSSSGDEWVSHMGRKAQAAEREMRAFGELPPLRRPESTGPS